MVRIRDGRLAFDQRRHVLRLVPRYHIVVALLPDDIFQVVLGYLRSAPGVGGVFVELGVELVLDGFVFVGGAVQVGGFVGVLGGWGRGRVGVGVG